MHLNNAFSIFWYFKCYLLNYSEIIHLQLIFDLEAFNMFFLVEIF